MGGRFGWGGRSLYVAEHYMAELTCKCVVWVSCKAGANQRHVVVRFRCLLCLAAMRLLSASKPLSVELRFVAFEPAGFRPSMRVFDNYNQNMLC